VWERTATGARKKPQTGVQSCPTPESVIDDCDLTVDRVSFIEETGLVAGTYEPGPPERRRGLCAAEERLPDVRSQPRTHMSIAVFAVTHQNAPIEVRERFALTPHAAQTLLRQLVGGGMAAEAVILSTCNRTELYLHQPSSRCPAVLLRLLSRYAGLGDAEVERYMARRYDGDAIEHLFRVVSGLESRVLGEAQIQGQVRDALENVAAEKSVRVVGPVLSRLFQSALRVGAQVRTDTEIGVGAGSIASAAVQAARRALGSLQGRTVLLVGAGEMARLALACIAKEPGIRLHLANRSVDRARALAVGTPANVVGLDAIEGVLAEADIVLCATAAPHPILSAAQIRVAQLQSERDRVVLDLAVPRDVEPAVGEVGRVRLLTTDDLDHEVQQNLARRQAAVPMAGRMVDAGVEEFCGWLRTREVVPVIRGIRDRAETLRRRETQRYLERLRHLPDTDRELIEELSRRLMNKLLHTPTVRIRDAGVSDGARHHVLHAARHLFDLPEPEIEESADPVGSADRVHAAAG
jgi:glutamyl-tRNA reductase